MSSDRPRQAGRGAIAAAALAVAALSLGGVMLALSGGDEQAGRTGARGATREAAASDAPTGAATLDPLVEEARPEPPSRAETTAEAGGAPLEEAREARRGRDADRARRDEREGRFRLSSDVVVNRGKVDDVARAMVGTRGRLKACVERAVGAGEVIGGKLAVTLELGSDGAVRHVGARAERGLPPAVVRCADSTLAGLRFVLPAGERGATLTATYTVTSRGDTTAERLPGQVFKGVRVGRGDRRPPPPGQRLVTHRPAARVDAREGRGDVRVGVAPHRGVPREAVDALLITVAVRELHTARFPEAVRTRGCRVRVAAIADRRVGALRVAVGKAGVDRAQIGHAAGERRLAVRGARGVGRGAILLAREERDAVRVGIAGRPLGAALGLEARSAGRVGEGEATAGTAAAARADGSPGAASPARSRGAALAAGSARAARAARAADTRAPAGSSGTSDAGAAASAARAAGPGAAASSARAANAARAASSARAADTRAPAGAASSTGAADAGAAAIAAGSTGAANAGAAAGSAGAARAAEAWAPAVTCRGPRASAAAWLAGPCGARRTGARAAGPLAGPSEERAALACGAAGRRAGPRGAGRAPCSACGRAEIGRCRRVAPAGGDEHRKQGDGAEETETAETRRETLAHGANLVGEGHEQGKRGW
jgi:hypothetical protein